MRPSKHPQPALGLAIRQLRTKRGVTQVSLAHDAGLASPSLSFIENGGTNPTWHTVKNLAAALDVSLADVAKLAAKLEDEM
jgi:transcriptional regulator with XRE-family HTH domain